MLPMRIIVALYVTLCACLVGAPVSASDAALRDLKRIEARGLRQLEPARIEELLRIAAPEHEGVVYSTAWLDAKPPATGGADFKCLSEALYFEARGETVKGQFAVAEVIMNRVRSSRFPNSVCGVVNQGTGRKYQCQFTYTCDGLAEAIGDRQAYARVGKVARAVLDGVAKPLTGGATHYHTTAVRPAWARVYHRTARIGTHVFYLHTYRSAANLP